jgi:cysteine sulfinate desulfinase/cysteine desulfurase-like protein
VTLVSRICCDVVVNIFAGVSSVALYHRSSHTLVILTTHLQLCRANKTFLHSDIAQMAGKVPVDVNDLGLDLASISSHKVTGRLPIVHACSCAAVVYG